LYGLTSDLRISCL